MNACACTRSIMDKRDPKLANQQPRQHCKLLIQGKISSQDDKSKADRGRQLTSHSVLCTGALVYMGSLLTSVYHITTGREPQRKVFEDYLWLLYDYTQMNTHSHTMLITQTQLQSIVNQSKIWHLVCLNTSISAILLFSPFLAMRNILHT